MAREVTFFENLTAPIAPGDAVGEIVYKSGDEILYRENLIAIEKIEKMTFWDMMLSSIRVYFMIF